MTRKLENVLIALLWVALAVYVMLRGLERLDGER